MFCVNAEPETQPTLERVMSIENEPGYIFWWAEGTEEVQTLRSEQGGLVTRASNVVG